MENGILNKPFTLPQSTAVFTTKHVIDDGKTITYVSHDREDGAWQFLSDDELDNPEAEARLVALHEILSIDNSLEALGGLPEGYSATRKDSSATWEIKREM